MPHRARKRSASGYYHVVSKGIADQLLFESNDDKFLYLELIRKAKSMFNISLHAYCLMDNHAHHIIEDQFNNISAFVKFVHERYAIHFAKTSGRTGGIFQRRFWSEPIETYGHLICAVRYVHANPAAAGICSASQYPWSSMGDYLGQSAVGIADTDFVLRMLGGIDGFIDWSSPKNATALPFPGSRLHNHLTDIEALRIAKGVIGDNLATVQASSGDIQLACVSTLYSRGFSKIQIVRLTGIGRRRIDTLLRCATGACPPSDDGATGACPPSDKAA